MPSDFRVIHPTGDFTDQEKKDIEKVSRWYAAASENERVWRTKARLWHDYYHGDQLDRKTLLIMEARNQPPIKFNMIKSIINLLTGQEIQGRTDINFVGFEDSDTLPSDVLTEIYRQANHEGYFQYEITRAFQDGVIGGRGCMLIDQDENTNEIFREYVEWQEIFVDASSKRVDYKDARHVFRAKWVDLDVAIEQFPDKEKELREVMANTGTEDNTFETETAGRQATEYFDDLLDDFSKWTDPKRARLKLIEGWYKEYDAEKKKSIVMHCLFTDHFFISTPEPFGRNHEEFPIVFTHYNRDRRGDPYGLVKDLIDPQDVINKSFSKSMHILGTRQILAEKGALPNIRKVQEEICKPDAIINDFEDGALSNNRIRIEESRGDSALAFQHFEIGVNAMHRVSGVNPELQGLNTNARSGTAISMRLRQGNTVLTSLYDCLEKTKKKCAELYVYLMAQYMTNKEVMRYKLPNGEIQNIELNGVTVESVGDMLLEVQNNNLKDIFKYDIIISESAKANNADEATLNNLVELTKVAPALQNNPQFLAAIINASAISNKEELARAILSPAGGEGGDGQPTS